MKKHFPNGTEKIRLRPFWALLISLSFLISLSSCAVLEKNVEFEATEGTTRTLADERQEPALSGASSAAKPRAAEATSQASVSKNRPRKKTVESKRVGANPVDTSNEFDCGDLNRAAGVTLPVAAQEENNASFADLDRNLRAYLESCGLGEAAIGLVYDDLSSGRRYVYQPDQRVLAASVIKVAMSMVCAQLVQEGIFREDMKICYLPGEQFSADNLDASRVGQLVPLKELLASAVMYSDNSATSVIFNYFHRHGRDIHLFMDERCGTHYSGDITMSAREGAGLVNSLIAYSGQYPMYQDILGWMASSSWSSFLTAGIPVTVAHKYGNLNAANNEIGLVYGSPQFVYAVFTESIPAYSILPQIGALLYSYSVDQPFTPVPVTLPADWENPDESDEGSETEEETAYPTYTPPPPTEPTPMATVVVEESSRFGR